MAEKNYMKSRGSVQKREPKEFDERVIEVSRVSRVVKGGRRIRFRALVVIGDHKGRVGTGVAKATEVTDAVRKATNFAKKHIINVPIINGSIPHEVFVKYGSARVMLKPATPGTTIVAGGSVRVVAELAGITDLLSKIMGSANKINNVMATMKAFSSFNLEVVKKMREYAKKAEGKVSTKVVVSADVIASDSSQLGNQSEVEVKQSVSAEKIEETKPKKKPVKKTVKKVEKE
jgi:small subunit ribosomal protein S5